jgi:hypothetical protein
MDGQSLIFVVGGLSSALMLMTMCRFAAAVTAMLLPITTQILRQSPDHLLTILGCHLVLSWSIWAFMSRRLTTTARDGTRSAPEPRERPLPNQHEP